MYYFSGQKYNIEARLARKPRNTEGVCLQFETKEQIAGKAGWCPLTKEEFWPICLCVGDTFYMKAYYDHADRDEAKQETPYKKWKVTRRNIVPSGPSAQEMNGIVRLELEILDSEVD